MTRAISDEQWFASETPTVGPVWALPAIATPVGTNGSAPTARKPRRSLLLVDPRDVEVRDIEWIDHGYLPKGELTILQGHGGTNKGTHCCYWAAAVTNGNTPDGVPAGVVIAAAEDSIGSVLKPRLIAAGADMSRVRFIKIARDGYEDGICIPDDVDLLQDAIEEIGAKLVIIDPILSHLSSGVDSYRDHEVKRALAPLKALAEATGCAVLAVHHLNKDTTRGALRSSQASGAFINTARVVLAMAADDEDENLRVLEVVKANITKVGARVQLRVEPVTIAGVTDPVVRTVPAGVAAKTVDELLKAGNSGKGAKIATAKELILAEVALGEQTMDYLKARGAALDISGDTVWRAANKLKGDGKVRCGNSGPGTKWYWRLISPDSAVVTSATVPGKPHEQKTSVDTTTTDINDFGRKSEQLTADFLTSASTRRPAA